MRTRKALSGNWPLVLFGLLLTVAGCGGGNGDSAQPRLPLAVRIYTTNADLPGGEISALEASVDNDGTVSGVTWSLNGEGTLTPAPATATSSPTLDCTYSAPAVVTDKFTATVTATAIRDTSKTASVTLTIYPNVTIGKEPLPQAKAGTAYSYQLTGGGGKGNGLTYVLVSGLLPDGLTLSRDGLLSGTPTVTGTYPLTIQAQDTTFTYVAAATATYSLSVF